MKIIPLLIIVAFLAFAIRVGDIVTDVRIIDQAMSGSVYAAAPQEKESHASVDVPEGLPESESVPMPESDWADPTTLDMQFSETQTSVLKELKERRERLDARENRIKQREALMEVTEKRIGEKIDELSILRTEIEELLGEQSEEEKARIESLVKIYSGMKPKDAAAVFNDLDIDILLDVISKMSERKSAPILAAMDTNKVKDLTVMLAEQRKLPDFSLE